MGEVEPTTERSAPEIFGFDGALVALKQGRRVARAMWPEGSFVAYQRGYPTGIPINANTAKTMGLPEGTMVRFAPYLMAYDGVERICAPWQPGQLDVLAPDWRIVP